MESLQHPRVQRLAALARGVRVAAEAGVAAGGADPAAGGLREMRLVPHPAAAVAAAAGVDDAPPRQHEDQDRGQPQRQRGQPALRVEALDQAVVRFDGDEFHGPHS